MSRQIPWGLAEPSIRLIEERVRRLEADVALLTHAVQALTRELTEHREQEAEDIVPGRAGGGPPAPADDVAAGGPPASVGDVAAASAGRSGGGAPTPAGGDVVAAPGQAGGGAPDAAAGPRSYRRRQRASQKE